MSTPAVVFSMNELSIFSRWKFCSCILTILRRISTISSGCSGLFRAAYSSIAHLTIFDSVVSFFSASSFKSWLHSSVIAIVFFILFTLFLVSIFVQFWCQDHSKTQWKTQEHKGMPQQPLESSVGPSFIRPISGVFSPWFLYNAIRFLYDAIIIPYNTIHFLYNAITFLYHAIQRFFTFFPKNKRKVP